MAPRPREVLVVNAGSSTLKYRVVDPESRETRLRGQVERIEDSGFDVALRRLHEDLDAHGVTSADLVAVGHRVVHGGSLFTGPTVVTEEVLAQIDELTALAPQHQPPAVAGIRSARGAFPDVPQVAVFDTALFTGLPAAAATYAIDADVAEAAGVRRFGAHGTSHAHVAAEAASILGRSPEGVDLITLHLGSGASAAAIRAGRPLDTSMGLTPLEGLVMGHRGGDLDPGVLVHLLRRGDVDLDGLERLLQERSGLVGLAGVGDFRDLCARVDHGDERARLAYDVYCHRLRKYVGAYLAVLGRADAVVFTGGVGENSARLRVDALRGLEGLGISVDPERNAAEGATARVVSPEGSPVMVLVVPADEELAIARQVAALLAGPEGPAATR